MLIVPATLWFTAAGKIATNATDNPHLCETCPCGGPQTLERVLWEREHATDTEEHWAVSTSYNTGHLVAETFDDVDNERWYYRAKSGHTSTAADEPGVGASWTDKWSVASVTLAECQTKLNTLGPYFLSNNAYAGGGSAPTAHPGTYGDSAADLADALDLAADLLASLDSGGLTANRPYWEGNHDPADSTESGDFDLAAADYQSAGTWVSNFVIWSSGHRTSGQYNLNQAKIYSSQLSWELPARTSDAARLRDIDVYVYRNPQGGTNNLTTNHGQTWLDWDEENWGVFMTLENWPIDDWTVVAANSDHEDLASNRVDPTGGHYVTPYWAQFSLPNTAHFLSRWDFNAYPNGSL